jgi:hypothetical protein
MCKEYTALPYQLEYQLELVVRREVHNDLGEALKSEQNLFQRI